MSSEPGLVEYLDEAAGWDRDRELALRATARRAWWVAGIAVALAAVAVGAVAVMSPLKTVEPFVVRVDNTTGVIDVVPTYVGGAPGSASSAELVTRHLLHSYVTARERYTAAFAQADYETVGAYHSAPMNARWYALWDRMNPESPLNQYRDGSTVRVQIQAISFLAAAAGASATPLAQVRFLTAKRIGGGGLEQVTHWIATLQYGYGKPAKNDRQRALNPLGFRVLEYRKEPELTGENAPVTVVASGVRAGSGS